MSLFLRRRLVWLTVLMIWVGMVSAVVVYQATTGEIVMRYREEEASTQVQEEETVQTLAARVEEELNGEEDFFVVFRLERDRSRSQQLDLLRELITGPDTEAAVLEESQRRIILITERMEKEMEVESLIRARGYEDALAFIHNDSIDIIVLHPHSLIEENVEEIADTASRVTGFPYQEITILERSLAGRIPSYP